MSQSHKILRIVPGMQEICGRVSSVVQHSTCPGLDVSSRRVRIRRAKGSWKGWCVRTQDIPLNSWWKQCPGGVCPQLPVLPWAAHLKLTQPATPISVCSLENGHLRKIKSPSFPKSPSCQREGQDENRAIWSQNHALHQPCGERSSSWTWTVIDQNVDPDCGHSYTAVEVCQKVQRASFPEYRLCL